MMKGESVIRRLMWIVSLGLLMTALTIGASPATFATGITTTTKYPSTTTKPPPTTTTKYTTKPPTTTTTKYPTTTTKAKKPKCNAGKGNGPEYITVGKTTVECDPGNSGAHNQAPEP